MWGQTERSPSFRGNGIRERSVCPQVFPRFSQVFAPSPLIPHVLTHVNRKFACSSHSGVTCPYFTRCRRQRAFLFPPAMHLGLAEHPPDQPPGPPPRHPTMAGLIATLPGQDQPRIQDGIRQLIGRDSGADRRSAGRSGQESPRKPQRIGG